MMEKVNHVELEKKGRNRNTEVHNETTIGKY
jgi:hypothetical protein